MYKIWTLLFILLATSVVPDNSFAQEKESQIKKYVKKGRKAYTKGQYWKAKSYYDKVTSSSSKKPQYWLEAGVVYYESQVEREKALLMFEKALEFSAESGDTIPEIFYYKAKANHFAGSYEKAIEDYNLFLNYVKNNKKGIERRKEVVREIEICNNGVDLRNQESKRYTEIKNMGPRVNSDSPDYAPVVTNDEDLILFCSRRPPGSKKNVDGLYFEDIFYTTKRNNGSWNQAEVIDKSSGYLSKEINEGKQHEAPISLSADGKTLFIYKQNSIWKSELDADGKWSIPRKMNQNEGHPFRRVLLRTTSLASALLRGSSRRAIPGPSLLARHPCLATPYATPTLGLLKGIRDRGAWKCPSNESKKSIRLFLRARPDRRHQPPLSVGRMESAWRGASGMDAARGVKGHGWPLYAGPRSVDGMREVERSETRMEGQDFLVPFGATAKRDSPSRAKPMRLPTTPIGLTQRTQSPNALHAATPSGTQTTFQVPQC